VINVTLIGLLALGFIEGYLLYVSDRLRPSTRTIKLFDFTEGISRAQCRMSRVRSDATARITRRGVMPFLLAYEVS